MINPYASPNSAPIARDIASERLNAVSRIFLWVGLLGCFFSVPCVIFCLIVFILNLVGHPMVEPMHPLFALFPIALYSSILLLCVTYVVTARQIKQRSYNVRDQALALSFLLILGIPIFTIPGVLCLVWLRKYFRASGDVPQLNIEDRDHVDARQTDNEPA